jgi:hypothetical protein
MTQDLRDAMAALEGVAESPSMFKDDDLAYWVHGKEIAHFEGAGVVDIRLTRGVIRSRRQALVADHRVDLRDSGSDWVTVRFSLPEDRGFVLEMVEEAAAIHRPPPGVTAEPPPTGPELERRRRFH